MQRHPLDPVSLVAGLLFAGLSISLMTGRITAGTRHLTLVWAVGAIILGLGLLATGRHSRPQAIESESQTGNGTAGEMGED
ncbi:MAG TPA: hypothetical protein VGA71_07070 [Actinomycetota bacterium]